ncbi:MAG: cytochrome C oxidase subunit IV family protein [Myxococcaceae bacterium]|nr:cytochrome C oxidase subunit IV family protein [Myxococcaceae bacterium]MCI0672191.1 cytochrome C oxidase subunit IV family protein [Myxococcaceae bacterium]
MDPKDYKKNVAEYADAAHGVVHSHFRTYLIVFMALLLGTALTYTTGRMHLGNWALVIALVIAFTKGTLVAMYFMHLAEAKGTTRLLMGICLLFIAVLIGYVLGDFGTRFRPANSQGSKWSDLPASSTTRGESPDMPRELGTTP